MNESQSRWSPEEELDHLIEFAQSIAEGANQGYEGTRKVALGAAGEIAQRVYHENLSKAFSIKKHAVATAVSHFIVLSQRNKVVTASAAHTDLLPIAHPNSTREHSLHPNEVLKARARWYADDPKITDPAIKTLIASAISAPLGSAEQVYAATRLSQLSALPLVALTAAFKPGANNFFWMVQLRDRKGRWAEMGGGVSVFVRMPDGTLRRFSGTVVGARSSERNKSDRYNYFVVEVGDNSLVKVPASKAETIKALIPSQRTKNGFSKTTARAATGDPILDFSDLKKVSAPPGYKKDRNWSPDENEVEYYGTRADMGEMFTDGNYRIRKFKKARNSWLARDDFSVARQREGEGQDVVAVGAGPNGELDLDKPVFFVSRDDERGNRVFAAVQSWEDAMAFARQDEPRYKEGELPSPKRNPRFKNPNEEAAAGRAPSNAPIAPGKAPRRPAPPAAPGARVQPSRIETGDVLNLKEDLDALPTGARVFDMLGGVYEKNSRGTWDQITRGRADKSVALKKNWTPSKSIVPRTLMFLDTPRSKTKAPRRPKTRKPAAERPTFRPVPEPDAGPEEAPEVAPTPEAPEAPAAPEPEAPAAEAPATPKVRRIAPGEKATRDELDNLPAGTVVKRDSRAYEKDRAGGDSWYEVNPATSKEPLPSKVTDEKGFIYPARLPRDGEFEVERVPGYDKNAPGTGIVESVQLNKPREGDFIKTENGEWTKVVKLDRTRRKVPSDKAGRADATWETFDYTFENGDGYRVTTINGGLGFEGGRERREVVRGVEGLEEAPTPEPEAPEAEPREMPDRSTEAPITDIEDPSAPEAIDELPEGGDIVTPGRRVPTEAPRYVPVGPTEGQSSADFTDDPVELAQKFTRDQLVSGLKDALDNDSDFVTLPFSDGDEPVPVEAIFEAVRMSRRPAATEPAPLPDGVREQREALDARINELLESGDIIRDEQGRLTATTSEGQEVIDQSDELDAFEDQQRGLEVSRDGLPPLLEGLSDEELQDYLETGDYRSYLPENDDFTDVPEGFYVIDSLPSDAQDLAPNSYPDRLARDFTPDELKTQLRDAIRSGSGYGVLGIENQAGEIEEMRVPAEALRDALQLQGEDTNEFIRSALSDPVRTVPAQAPKPRAQRKKSTSESPNPTVAYMFKNGRAFIAQRAGKVFSNNPEVRKYLDDNGFTYDEAKNIAYETSEMDEASFYNFMRGLRDEFGIDFLPGKGQESIDFDKDPSPKVTPTAKSKKIVVADDQVDALQGLVNRKNELDAEIADLEADPNADPATVEARKRTRDTVQKNIDKIRGVDDGEGPRRVNIPTSGLQEGDVVQSDFFTIESIAEEPGVVWGGQQVYRITGYYPGSQTQSSKLWKADREIPIFRGVTPPEKGDLPEINQPRAEEDFVKLPVKQNMDKYEKIEDYEGRGKGVYVPADPALRADFDRAYRSYLEELDRRMATWQPNLEEANTEATAAGNPPITSGPRSAINISPADLKPGDIFYKQNTDGSYEAFVVEDVKVKKAATFTRILRRKIDTPAGEGQTDANPEQQQWLDEVRQAHSDIDNEDSNMRVAALSAALNDEILNGNAKIDRDTGQLKSGDKAQWLIDQIDNLSNGRDISVGGETPVDEAFEEITEEVTIGVDKVEITGYYPGYASQKLTRQANTTLSAIRGEPTLPAKGEDRLPQSPDPRDPDYIDKYDARKAAIAEASRAYPVTPTDVADLKAATLRKPYSEAVRPAFDGKIAELIEQNEVNTGQGVKELLKNNRVVYFDFETVGKGFDEENPDSPIQVAAIVYEGGVEVDRINLYINPEESLGDYYYDSWSRPKSSKVGTKAKQIIADRFVEIEKTGEDEWTDLETGQKFDTDGALSRGKLLKIDREGNTSLRADRMRDSDGNPVTEEWLATQPGKKEQLQKLVDFIGQDAILVGYNGQFDTNLLEKWAEKLGIDYTPNGYFDPMAIRKSLTEGQYATKNSLRDAAKTYGMDRPDEDWHNADVDVDVLPGLVDSLLSEMPDLSDDFDLDARREKFERDRAYDERKMEIYQRELARQKGASVDDVQENEIPVTETKKPTTTGSSVDEEVLIETTDRTAESVFGDEVNTEWFKDDENAYNVAPAGEATFNDVVVGDGIATEGGAYNEVVDVLPNPDSPNGAVILHRDLETNRLYETKVADRNTKLTGAPLRRRVELEGLTSSEIKQLANAAQKRKTAAAQRGKNPGKPKVKAVTEPARQKSKKIDEAVEAGAPSEDLEKPALPGSFQHLDANNLPIDEKDKVRNVKDPESGVGEVMYNKNKGMVRVKFPNAAKPYKRKPHDVAADSLELVDMPEGQRRVAEASRQREKAANKTTKDRKVESITPDSPEGMSRRVRALGSYLVNGPGYSREIGDALKRATRAISQGNLKEAQYWINEAEASDKRLKQRNRDTASLRSEFEARRNSLTKNPEDPAFTPVVQNYLNRADEFFRGGDTRKALAELTKAEDTFFAYGDADIEVLETGDDVAPAGSNVATQQAYRLFERESVLESARLEKEGVEGKTPLRELTRAQARELLIRLQTTDYDIPNKEARLAALVDAAESGDYEEFEELGFSIDFDRQKYLDSQGRSPEGVRSRDASDEPAINEALAEFRKLEGSQSDENAQGDKEVLEEGEAARKASELNEAPTPSVTHLIEAGLLAPGDAVLYDGPEGPESGVVSEIEELPNRRFQVTIVDDNGQSRVRIFSGSELVEIFPDIPDSDPVDNMNYGVPGDGGDGSMNHFNMALPSESDDPGEDTANDADRPASQGSEDDFANLEVPATKEQRDILAAALDGKSIGVTAVAGSGKSTTLRLLANVLKDRQAGKKLLYLAFGRDIRAEAEEKMPDNTEVRTTGSIAYFGVDKFIKEKMDLQSEREVPYISTFRGIAKELGIEQTTLSMNGESEEYAPDRIAKVVQDAVRNYAISADDELGIEHFDSRFDSIPEELLEYARSYWADISSPIKKERVDKGDDKFENVISEGKFKIDNDHIIKLWALSRPNIFAGETSSGLKKGVVDLIMIDEAQDINPVVGKVLADQVGQKIYVGDSAQAIYGFRGANDELEKAPVDVQLSLTQSFRFGTGIAGVANRFLSLLGSKHRVRGSDRPSKINEGIEDPDAILVRENQEGLALSEELLAAGKRVEITEDTYNNYMSLLSSARWLLRGNTERAKPFNMHDDLDLFEDWNDFGSAIGRREARSGAQFYRLVNNYIQTYGTGKGLDKLEEFLGGLTINSKGLKPASEYKGVNLKNVRPASFGSLISNKKENGQLDYFITPDGQILLRQSPPYIENKKVSENINERRKTRLRRLGFVWDQKAAFPGAPIRDGEETSGAWVRKLSQDEIDAGRTAPEVLPTNERKDLLDRLGRAFNNFRETDEPTILISTAHKAKGLEWSKVRLSPGFREYGAEFDPATRVFKMPPPEEMNLLYVAVTRAMDELDVGGGGWIYSVTDDEEEEFSFPDPDENVMGMALPVESTDEETFVSDVGAAKTKSEEIADRVSALVIKAIEEGGLPPWQKPWSEAGSDGIIPFSVTSNKAYKGMNIMILWSAQQINGWSDNRWITFAEAKKRGGSVKKGEKSTKIVNWSPVIKEVEKEDGTKERVVAYMKATEHDVFNLEQTSGVDLPEREIPEPLPVSEAEGLLLERYKGAPEVRNSPQDQAFWSPSGDYISMPLREQFATQEAYLETLFHEMVHSTGHKSRLDRSDLMDKYGTHRASRGEEELVAEIGAALLAARLGVDLDFQQVAAYAKSWLAPLKNDTSMIVKATRKAQAAVDYILGDAEPNLGESGVSGADVPAVVAQRLGLELPQSYRGEYGRPGGELETPSAARESIGDVGRELEEDPLTDIEPPARAEELPDAGETEIEIIEAPVAADPGGDDPPGGGNRGPNFAPPPNDDEDDGGPEPIDEPFDPLSVDTGREVKSRGYNLLHTPEDFKDVEKPRGYQSPTIISPPPESERKRGDFYEVDFNLYRDIVDSMSKDIPIIFSYGKEIISGVPLRTWSLGTSNPVVEVEMDNGTVSNFSPSRFRYIDPNEYSNILDNLGLPASEDRNVGESGRTGEEIAAEGPTETGVASLQGEFQPGTPNTGELRNGMNYSIDMFERRLTSGRTTGENYGVRRMTVSGNTFPNREALKAAGFRYDGDTKTWSKSYLGQVFETSRLTQEVINNNPNPEITSDMEKLS
jgi:antirestriction protein ArdC/DNA polymerase III epsilon subunit-like protein